MKPLGIRIQSRSIAIGKWAKSQQALRADQAAGPLLFAANRRWIQLRGSGRLPAPISIVSWPETLTSHPPILCGRRVVGFGLRRVWLDDPVVALDAGKFFGRGLFLGGKRDCRHGECRCDGGRREPGFEREGSCAQYSLIAAMRHRLSRDLRRLVERNRTNREQNYLWIGWRISFRAARERSADRLRCALPIEAGFG